MADTPADMPFWRRKKLSEMTATEWESLCDGCARCCLIKLEDVDDGEISYTDIACRLLDSGACRCTNYHRRATLVPDCVQLSPEKIADLGWMPSSCAYRLIAEGKDLHWWHRLVSGDPETVHRAGISVRGRVVPEDRGDDPEDRIVRWPE
ncbi:MAG: YcgN family cysteine cluster protein [Alphaproteobacteria bacterium]